jgi:uncharacterized protein
MGADPGRAAAASCPFEVSRPVMLQRWEQLTFLHWPFDPEVVQRILPPTLTVQVMDGSAWVGLVPFHMTVRAPGLPAIPWVSRFLETNVRTYVQDREGRSGIWFFSLDAARLAAVVVARATYRLPYFWSRMRLARRNALVRYDCTRRWPSGGATSSVRIEVGRPYRQDELTELDHLLTARWVLFSRTRDRHRFARAWHAPWPLHRADALDVQDGLLPAAGLPRPTDAPLVHYSPGVAVRVGAPERYHAADR